MEDGDGNILSPFTAADQEAESSAESSRSESNSAESGVTADSSRCRSGESCGISDTRAEECTVWTDEKHNSYLDHLESSFVRQLYYLLGGNSHKSFRSHEPPVNYYKSTDQFAILQNGCRQKINFGKKRTHLEASSDFYPRESPLTSHFADPKTIGVAAQGNLSSKEEINCCADNAFSGVSMRNPVEQIEYHLHDKRTKGSTGESSGQNFVDEDKEDNLYSSSLVTKRRKRDAEIDSSINDQVVPLGNVNQRDVHGASQIFSGYPQSFNIQNADDHHCFDKGS